MKINETHPREKGFVLWGHCQNILDDPRRIVKIPQLFHSIYFLFCLFPAPTPPNADYKLLSSKNLSDAQMAVTTKAVCNLKTCKRFTQA